MIDKITDNAYFVIDYSSLFTQIINYDPNVANQTILTVNFPDQEGKIEPEPELQWL